MEITIEADTTLLEKLIANLDKEQTIKIGIFNDSIAEIAKKLEFGVSHSYIPQLGKSVSIPARSFLQVPVEERLTKKIAIGRNKLLEDGMDYLAEKVAEELKKSVDKTLENGDSRWVANDAEWREYKETHGYDSGVLHYTNKLRQSIDVKVGE